MAVALGKRDNAGFRAACAHRIAEAVQRPATIAADILRANLRGPLRLPFVEACANQPLCYAIDHLMHSQVAPAGRTRALAPCIQGLLKRA